MPIRTSRPELRRIPALAEIQYGACHSEAELQAQRQITDPLADAVIAELRKSHPIRSPEDMLIEVRREAAAGGSPIYQQFLEETMRVPAWANFRRMRAGQRLIAAYGPFMGLSLLTGSLVGGYMFKKMAMVTALTGRLGMPGDISRRLEETSALVFSMALPGELEPGGRAHEILVRVRLLHGAIRQWMADSGRWKPHWDEPINQEDLAITLSLFSCWNVQSLLRMGVALSDREIESHHLLWRYAGHVLGIQEALLTASFDQEVAQYREMLKHQARPSECPPYGKKILDEVASKLPLFPEELAQEFLHQTTRHLVGDELVAGLEIEKKRYLGIPILRAVGRAYSFVHRRVPGGEALLYAAGSRQYRVALRRMARKRGLSYGVKTHDPAAVRRAHGLAAE
ncbi:MAG: oxygenase MpaB family protein [Polyangiaceae bacterium]